MINKWHSWLAMTKHDKLWHQNDMTDELDEYYQETKIIKKWSELSDVVYTYTRAKWSGHNLLFPFSNWQFYLGLIYMLPKYTGRWLFFRRAGQKAGCLKAVHEVRNPHKTYKLQTIARQYQIDVDKFQQICQKQLKYWPLLP